MRRVHFGPPSAHMLEALRTCDRREETASSKGKACVSNALRLTTLPKFVVQRLGAKWLVPRGDTIPSYIKKMYHQACQRPRVPGTEISDEIPRARIAKFEIYSSHLTTISFLYSSPGSRHLALDSTAHAVATSSPHGSRLSILPP